MKDFEDNYKLAFVKIRGHETNLIISSTGVLYKLTDGKIEIVKPYLEKCGHLRYSKKIDGKDVKMTVKAGDKVIAAKYSGTDIKIDGEEYTILHQSDILAIVE